MVVETVTVNEADPPETSVTLVVLRVIVGECDLADDMLDVSATVPAKPLRLESVMVDVP